MASSTGPDISTDGLVLALDAANPKSYPGTGTTWMDLSGNGNDGTLVNGPTYDSESIGNLLFDGINDYVQISHDASTMDFSNAQTICMWLRPETGANSARRNPYNQAYGGPGTLTRETNGGINYFFGTNGGNGSPYSSINSAYTVAENELAFITFSRNQSTNNSKAYKNGVLKNTGAAGGYASTANGTSPILIGDGYVSGWLGKIYLCAVYNRQLSDSEVLQNFNATRSRFGI